MQDIDKSITASRKAYDSAFKKLTEGNGNILKRVKDIKALGINSSKTLPIEPVDEE